MFLWYLVAPLVGSLLVKLRDFLFNGLMAPLESISLKKYMLCQLCFCKNQVEKSRNHLVALERRFKLWNEGNIYELLDESKEIQERLPSTNTPMNL